MGTLLINIITLAVFSIFSGKVRSIQANWNTGIAIKLQAREDALDNILMKINKGTRIKISKQTMALIRRADKKRYFAENRSVFKKLKHFELLSKQL